MKNNLQLVAFGLGSLVVATACGATPPSPSAAPRVAPVVTPENAVRSVFAGGCFWCLETAFEGQPGVVAVVSGYAGGSQTNPSYEAVSSGRTGHYEVVEVTWDPAQTTYDALLAIFWPNVDPLDDGGQFCDRGPQYRTAVFVADEAQRQAALASLDAAERRLGDRQIVTPILEAAPFWAAEDYHQDFWKKSPVRYQSYRLGCGRDRRLAELWGAPPTSAVH